MDVQILLYSYSGHTLALIEQLRVQLETLGITYQIIDISKVESSDVLLVSRKILIATPIQRFALSQNMKQWLKGLRPQGDKAVGVLLVHALSSHVFGYVQAKKWLFKQMNRNDWSIELFLDLNEKQRLNPREVDLVLTQILDWIKV